MRIGRLRLHRLSSKFLLLTVPAVVLAALLFVAGSFLLRRDEREAINREVLVEQARAHATLLSYPLWNLDELTVSAILRSLADVPRVQCVELRDVSGMPTPEPVGRCARLEGLELVETPVSFVDGSGEHAVGRLHHWVDIHASRAEVWRDLGPLLLQLLLLVGVLILCSLVAFSRTVRRPLAQVGDSLRAFRKRGERQPVQWRSDDELGEFIEEYNAGLQRQELAERNLQAQLNFQMALHQTMPTPFAYLDAQLRLFDANPAFHDQLGIGREAMSHSMPGLLPTIDWADVLALGRGDVHTQELRGLAVRGRERGFSMACSPFFNADGSIRGYVLVLQDITQRLEDEKALREAMARSEAALSELHRTQEILIQSEKLASLGSLVAGIAHEINTPLGASVTVSSHLVDLVEQLAASFDRGALKRSELGQFFEQAREGLAILQRSLDTANEQVRRFKQVAVDQGGLVRRRFDLHQVVEDVVATLRPQLRNSRHRILVEVPPSLWLDSLPGPLEQILSNCINNAIVHGFEDCPAGTVTVSAVPLGEDWVRIVVADNGRGMSAEHVKRVFDPFFTTHLGRGGSGLGMSLAYQLAGSVLHGRIAVDSEPGRGTRVRIELPMVLPADAPTRTAGAPAGPML